MIVKHHVPPDRPIMFKLSIKHYKIILKIPERFWKVTFFKALFPQFHRFNKEFHVHCKTREKVFTTRWQSCSCLTCPPPVPGYAKQVEVLRAHRDSKANRGSKVRPGTDQHVEILTISLSVFSVVLCFL